MFAPTRTLWQAITQKQICEDIETHLYPHTGLDFFDQSKINDMNYDHYHLHDPADEEDLPLKWNEAAPCAQQSESFCLCGAACVHDCMFNHLGGICSACGEAPRSNDCWVLAKGSPRVI